MCTDSCDQYDWVFGVTQRPSCCEVVCRRAGWGGYANTVCLHSREMLIIAEDFDR